LVSKAYLSLWYPQLLKKKWNGTIFPIRESQWSLTRDLELKKNYEGYDFSSFVSFSFIDLAPVILKLQFFFVLKALKDIENIFPFI